MPVFLAAPRPATAALTQIRDSDLNLTYLHRPTQLCSTVAIRSCTATASIAALDRPPITQTPHPRHSNPHSARRPAPASPIAVSSLGGFRTPAAGVNGTACERPASENLHISGLRQ